MAKKSKSSPISINNYLNFEKDGWKDEEIIRVMIAHRSKKSLNMFVTGGDDARKLYQTFYKHVDKRVLALTGCIYNPNDVCDSVTLENGHEVLLFDVLSITFEDIQGHQFQAYRYSDGFKLPKVENR